jgi:hypothetical protein
VPGAGTLAVVCHDFVGHICSNVDQNGIDGMDDHRVFLWDNLAAHHSPLMHNASTLTLFIHHGRYLWSLQD